MSVRSIAGVSLVAVIISCTFVLLPLRAAPGELHAEVSHALFETGAPEQGPEHRADGDLSDEVISCRLAAEVEWVRFLNLARSSFAGDRKRYQLFASNETTELITTTQLMEPLWRSYQESVIKNGPNKDDYLRVYVIDGLKKVTPLRREILHRFLVETLDSELSHEYISRDFPKRDE